MCFQALAPGLLVVSMVLAMMLSLDSDARLVEKGSNVVMDGENVGLRLDRRTESHVFFLKHI
jgi:hypothetical protein